MDIDKIVDVNKATVRELAKQGFPVDEAYGSIRLGSKDCGVFVHCTGFIKIWTQDPKVDFEHEILLETTQESKPFAFTAEDMRDLRLNPDKLWWLCHRMHKYGYEDYCDED